MTRAGILAALLALPMAAQAQEASLIPTNGITTNVRTWGDPKAPAVVLMHGWMGTSHTWRKLAPLLAADRFVIVPDMRGYGASDKPDAGYDGATLAADIRGVMKHFGAQRAGSPRTPPICKTTGPQTACRLPTGR